ncbi:hypothetical protein L1887_42400 [Cichorium endivia]|nr:hypothetical protein L1887_42400 [Cichorium endivia]
MILNFSIRGDDVVCIFCHCIRVSPCISFIGHVIAYVSLVCVIRRSYHLLVVLVLQTQCNPSLFTHFLCNNCGKNWTTNVHKIYTSFILMSSWS